MTYPKVLTQHSLAGTGNKHGHLSRYSRYSGSASIAQPLDYQADCGDKISERSAARHTHAHNTILHYTGNNDRGQAESAFPRNILMIPNLNQLRRPRALLGQLTAVQLVKNCSAVIELHGLLPRPQQRVPGPHPEILEFRPHSCHTSKTLSRFYGVGFDW